MMKLKRRAAFAGGALALGGVLLLSGCAGTDGTAAAASTTDTSTEEQARVAPGLTGEIAALTGQTFQLQDSDSQTAVTYSDATTFTSTLAATLADVSVGQCVNLSSAAAADGTDAATVPTSVAVTDAVDGACASGLGELGGGGMPGGTPPTDMPTDMPTDLPEDMPMGADGTAPTGIPTDLPADAGGFGTRTTGLVTAVTATAITVASTDVDGVVASETVTVDDSTSYTKTSASDASALAVGLCASAQGEADDTGSFAASAVALSVTGDDGCVSAMAGPGGRMGGDANE
ncbi:hypothetical protein E3O11_06330 [Cryobacterium levicorallinum]|uniref:DUF5666 domain-containing protein n=1 Tax=Cryobacterium levicorallinum TaxID=995038 RepID=A0A1I2YPQ0_9MICO|nr:DUF5666 domain-containing protein [Cryobacterium levicorallinum]TFB86096.1 hypothetical protein E3O11_06330 [Cryobacterium levicorallinum]GEP27635.1 hypothetical protein CLE01_22330 [Cryobacterium levicorallinum]SFH27538.1 hypothetical protein SAMN05216274_102253 [Cryobacterium levicorallinum]